MYSNSQRMSFGATHFFFSGILFKTLNSGKFVFCTIICGNFSVLFPILFSKLFRFVSFRFVPFQRIVYSVSLTKFKSTILNISNQVLLQSISLLCKFYFHVMLRQLYALASTCTFYKFHYIEEYWILENVDMSILE